MATLTADGAGIYYRESGTGAPVLLIHGAAGSADIWLGTFVELGSRCWVVAYDRRGYRYSSGPPVADYHRRGDDAAAILRWASSYASGGCAFERMPQAMQEAMLDTADATMADLDAGTGEEISMGQAAGIRCPVTCLLGTLTAPAIASATNRIARGLPQARLVRIEGAGHAIHFDRPDAFVAAIQEHLEEVPAMWKEQGLDRPARNMA